MSDRVAANAIAETILNMEMQNEAFQIQIDGFQSRIDSNLAAIAEMEPHAVWAEPMPTVDPVK